MKLIHKISYFILTKSIGLYINLMGFLFPEKATKLAYRYFTEPRDGKLDSNKIPKILSEAHPEIVSFGQHQIQTYTWKGNDHRILLVHGWESNASRWERIINWLKKSGSTIIALDGPAQGLSSGTEFNIPEYARFVDAIMQRFNPKYIIGHSMGGATCIYYQYTYQNPLLEKMVILGAPSEFIIVLNNYKKTISLNKKVSRLLDQRIMERFNIDPYAFSGKHFASSLSLKGLIAHDEDDTVVSYNEGKQIAEAWKSAEFISTKGLGHSLHDDQLYQQIYHFLFEAD
ncbi:alpha/beta hydrolase [Flavobacterium cerinum]|uniref:Alpha/beta hydrolase n=1 Tax=Flavobacterium cerinum TaxID=2502784 RepID=A0ABY5IWA6_9FLAO|nr:alpha/beta fold hydrolase [Flavobacterium cerinum]UUC47113.1 alpha/beta hydrolase [Flavobacterium cerinum]